MNIKGGQKMFRKIRENKKGFTLAELLIVVAIIGVLVAVSIPIFTAQLRKSRLATNQANARAAKAGAVAAYLDESNAGTSGFNYNYDVGTGKGAKSGGSIAGGSTSASSLTIDSWKASAHWGANTYKHWTVAIDANGDIESISYSE